MALLIVFVSDANCGYELIRELFIVYKINFEQLLMGNIYILLFCIILCCVDYYVWQRKLAKSSTNGTEMVLQKMVKVTNLLTWLTVSALIAFHFSVVSLTFSALALLSGVLSLFSCHKAGCSKDVIRIYAVMALILVGNVAMFYR